MMGCNGVIIPGKKQQNLLLPLMVNMGKYFYDGNIFYLESNRQCDVDEREEEKQYFCQLLYFYCCGDNGVGDGVVNVSTQDSV